MKKIDIVSAWFYEDSSNPDNLYVSLKILDIDATIKTKTTSLFTGFLNLIKQLLFKSALPSDTDAYQAVFAVCWVKSNSYYSTLVHHNPDGSIYFWFGKSSTDYNDNIDIWYDIAGTFDKENNIITWVIPKDKIDNPHMGTKLIGISAHTHLRQLSDAGEGPDLAKDLAGNAKDYTIKF